MSCYPRVREQFNFKGESVHSFFGRLTVLIFGISLIAALGASSASAGFKAEIGNASQSALVKKGLKVSLSGRPGAKVRVSLQSRSFDEGLRRASKPKNVRLGKSGRKKIKVKLTPAARAAARTCSARTLIASAKSGKVVRKKSTAMDRTLAACRLKPINQLKAATCEFIAQPNQGNCMLPWPSDFYTRSDKGSPTGKRIDFPVRAMPKNKSSKPIDPTLYSASDGFSQGQGILVKVPGIDTAEDVAANDFVPLDELSRYSERDQRAVVIEARTGKRWPIWVEIDANASNPETAALMISPATNFNPKGRYIVALRNLSDGQADSLEAPNGFRYFRDDIPTRADAVNKRRKHYEGIFKTLRKAKIKRSELYLAWDFTVASNENNYGRALHMRDEAFAELGDTSMGDEIIQGDAPAFTVTSQPTEDLGPKVARRVNGSFTVPCFLTKGCQATGEMDLDKDGMPKRMGTYQANFECIIPPVGLQGPTPPKLRPFIYGHGLLGLATEVVYSPVSRGLAQDYQSIACATNEIGMAADDALFVVPQILTEMSSFNQLADRLQQGLLNELFLARLMYHPDGLGTDPAFQDGDGLTPGESVIDTDDVYYVGASQGGIMGGPLTAISPDFIQSALIVGGMNYSTLLTRSSNWERFKAIFNPSYPNEIDRPLVLNIAQMLWDRGEPNGYAHVTTDNPPPNTPSTGSASTWHWETIRSPTSPVTSWRGRWA